MPREQRRISRLALGARARVIEAALRVPATVRILVFSMTLVVVAAAVFARALVNQPAPLPTSFWALPLLAAGFCLAEMKVVNVHFRRETHSFSLSEFPAVIGLFYLSTTDYLLALLAGSAVALIVAERQPPAKLAFNLANFALTGSITQAVFHRLVSTGPGLEPIDWAAAFVATLAATVIGAFTTATVITISGGAPQYVKLPEMIQFGGAVAIANTSLALLAVALIQADPLMLLLLAVPLATVFVAYGAYVSEREKHERLELLYQSSRILQHSPELDSSLVALLEHARNMFRAEWAQMTLYPRRDGDDALRTTSRSDGGNEVMVPVAGLGDDPIESRVRRESLAFFHVPDAAAKATSPIRQAMVSPLRGESDLLGSIVIATRLTEATAFAAEDLKLL